MAYMYHWGRRALSNEICLIKYVSTRIIYWSCEKALKQFLDQGASDLFMPGTTGRSKCHEHINEFLALSAARWFDQYLMSLSIKHYSCDGKSDAVAGPCCQVRSSGDMKYSTAVMHMIGDEKHRHVSETFQKTGDYFPQNQELGSIYWFPSEKVSQQRLHVNFFFQTRN